MKSNNILLGMLAGLAAGILVGILIAPEKGSISRKRIFGNDDIYRDTLRIEFEELVDNILSKFDCTRREAEEMVAIGETDFVKSKKD